MVAAVISIAIELVQLPIPGRAADVDDVILNIAGALVLYAAWRLVRALTGLVTSTQPGR